MIAQQVQFNDKNIGEGEMLGGIMVDNEYIICGCCGGIFEVEEVGKENIFPLKWINISEEIKGE